MQGLPQFEALEVLAATDDERVAMLLAIPVVWHEGPDGIAHGRTSHVLAGMSRVESTLAGLLTARRCKSKGCAGLQNTGGPAASAVGLFAQRSCTGLAESARLQGTLEENPGRVAAEARRAAEKLRASTTMQGIDEDVLAFAELDQLTASIIAGTLASLDEVAAQATRLARTAERRERLLDTAILRLLRGDQTGPLERLRKLARGSDSTWRPATSTILLLERCDGTLQWLDEFSTCASTEAPTTLSQAAGLTPAELANALKDGTPVDQAIRNAWQKTLLETAQAIPGWWTDTSASWRADTRTAIAVIHPRAAALHPEVVEAFKAGSDDTLLIGPYPVMASLVSVAAVAVAPLDQDLTPGMLETLSTLVRDEDYQPDDLPGLVSTARLLDR